MIFNICLIIIVLNMIIFKKNKKHFVISTFFMLFLVAGLRKYTIGTDLELHYANNYILFSKMNFEQIFSVIEQGSYYDAGLIMFMKILSLICSDIQFFIIVTSAITYGLVGRYIYKHSKNVYLETILFYTTFTYFMYMNIIAQGISIAIILFGIDYLEKREYIKYSLVVILANFIHSSALIGLIFIPLRMLKDKKSNIYKVGLISIMTIIFINTLLPFILKYIFPQFAYYFNSNSINTIDKQQIAHMFLYIFCLMAGLLFTHWSKGKQENLNEKDIKIERDYELEKTEKIVNSNFLFYMTILSVVFRFLALKNYIFSRMGFYFYIFAYSLLAKSVKEIKSKELKKAANMITFSFMLLFFIVLNNSLDVSYGVMPYEFFWE